MEKISINLLPPEFTAEEVKKTKFYRIQALGISIILLMIFLSIVTVSLRILQSNRIKVAQIEAEELERKVSSLSSRQASLVLLKSRLDAINQTLGTSSKPAEMYTLVNNLLPPTLKVSSVAVGREGSILISALAPDVQTLDQIFSDLLDKEKNENKVSKVSIEALNRGREGIFRVSFQVEGNK